MLQAGDLSSAVATVIPAYLDESAVHQLTIRATAGAQLALDSLPAQVAGTAPHAVRSVGPGLADRDRRPARWRWRSWAGSRPGHCAAARDLSVTLGASVALTLLAGLVVRAVAVDPLQDLGRSGLDPAARQLIADIDGNLRDGVARTFLELTAMVAAVAIGAAVVARGRSAWRREPRRMTAGLATAAIGAAVLVVVALPPASAAPTCNGSADLCERRYNQVSYLTSHNAMASSDRGYLGADQDPDITGQLDNGVRALMLDLHYWTTPEQAAPFVASLDPKTKAVWAPLARVFQPHPGVWLCHNVCQLGADPAVPQLQRGP